jgi:hypothetical protein
VELRGDARGTGRLVTALERLWWLPAVLAAAVSAALDVVTASPVDLPWFVQVGERLFSGGWDATFANPGLQVGPLLLAALGLVGHLAGALAVDPVTLTAFAVEIGAAVAVMAVVGRLVGDAPRRRIVQGAAGLLVVVLGLAHGLVVDGHPAQLFIPLLWVLAAEEARRGRELRGALLVTLSAGLEVWGVLGAVVLVLGRPRRLAPSAGVVAVGLLAMFAPFALAGELRMFEYRWLVDGGTLVALVLERGDVFPWTLRLLQAAAAAAAGIGCAFVLRASAHAVWAVPLAVVAVRVALDPTRHTWYLQAFQTLVVVAAAVLASDPRLGAALRRRPHPA